MKVEFADDQLALLASDRAAELGWPIETIKACRLRVLFLEAAPNEESLQNWRSLKLERMGEPHGQKCRIRAADGSWIYLLVSNDPRPTATVLSVERAA